MTVTYNAYCMVPSSAIDGPVVVSNCMVYAIGGLNPQQVKYIIIIMGIKLEGPRYIVP